VVVEVLLHVIVIFMEEVVAVVDWVGKII